MPFRIDATQKVTVGGRPYTIGILDNITIDDVLVVEMHIRASEIIDGQNLDRRVERDVRDILIRLGVDR